jgi:hypothetical protein
LRKFCRSLSFIVLAIASSTLIEAQQDACIALLQHGIYDSHTTKTSQQSYQEFRSSFCSWYSSYRASHSGGSGGVTIPVGDIPIGISTSLTYGEAEAISSAMCTADYSQGANAHQFEEASRYIDPNGASAFTACVTAEAGGLRMQTNINDDETQAVIAMAYQIPMGGGPAQIDRIDTLGWKCVDPPKGGSSLNSLLGKGKVFGYEQHSIVCKREVFEKPQIIAGQEVVSDKAMINIGTTAGSFIQQFKPVLYKEPLADTAKVMASYPKGTILPFAGRKVDIPQGWHLCDGTDGTVDLLGRAPFGTNDPAAIGHLLGSSSHHHAINLTTGSDLTGAHRIDPNGGGDWVAGAGHKHQLSGNTEDGSSLPPVTLIYFIQKIS